jgi:hypothetical protein
MELNQGAKPGSTAYDKRTIDQGYPIQSSQSHPELRVYVSTMIQPVPKSKRSRNIYPDR